MGSPAVGNISFTNTGGITFDDSNVSADAVQQKTGVAIIYKPPYRMVVKTT